MHVKSVVAVCWLLGVAGAATAQTTCSCGGTRVSYASLSSVLGNKTACASVGSERWQEFHSGLTAGSLIDYKLGPSHPVDPSETVGTWSIVMPTGSTAGVVRHAYKTGGTFDYAVCQTATAVNFCAASSGGRDITGARLLSGQVACP